VTHSPELRLQVKVSDASVDGDDELGQLQRPLVLQQLHDTIRSSVTRQTHVLQTTPTTMHCSSTARTIVYLQFEGSIDQRCNKLTLSLTLNPKTKLTLECGTTN